MSAAFETPHPGPFTARERDGVHEIVDGHGVVVATCHGEWAHIVALALALGITRGAELEEEAADVRAVMEGVDCHDAGELESHLRHLEERPLIDDWRALQSKAAKLDADLKGARERIREQEREISALRSEMGIGAGAAT